MPFTPFHMGAALIIKPAAQQNFSLITFGIAQIAMDIEPLIGMLNNAATLHGFTHTWMGAIVIGLLTALIAPYIYNRIIRRFNYEVHAYKLGWMSESEHPTHTVIIISALYGTISHVILDSFMHHDIHPLAPFSDLNPLLHIMGHDEVYQLCLILGVVGGLAWPISKWLTYRSKISKASKISTIS